MKRTYTIIVLRKANIHNEKLILGKLQKLQKLGKLQKCQLKCRDLESKTCLS